MPFPYVSSFVTFASECPRQRNSVITKAYVIHKKPVGKRILPGEK
jgi:hypothetical protein